MTIERLIVSAGITVASLAVSGVVNAVAGKKEKEKYGIPTKKEQRKAAKEAAKAAQQKAPEVAPAVEQPAPQQPVVQPVQQVAPQPVLLGYDAAGQPVYGYPQAQPQA